MNTSEEPIDGRPGASPASAGAVPHVVGHHVDLALRMLDDLGLQTRIVTTEVHDKTDRHVVGTTPSAGSPAHDGLVVEVLVGIAPVVGDYVGRDVDDAVRLAELTGHVVEVMTDDLSRTRTRGTVAAQEPAPGDRSRVILLHVTIDDPGPTTT